MLQGKAEFFLGNQFDISKVEKNWLGRVSQIISPEVEGFILFLVHSSRVSAFWLFLNSVLDEDHKTIKLPAISRRISAALIRYFLCIVVNFII